MHGIVLTLRFSASYLAANTTRNFQIYFYLHIEPSGLDAAH